MNQKIKITLGILATALALLSCNLPKGTAASPTKTSDTPAQASGTAETTTGIDTSAARLQAEDLPAGFRELTEQELLDMGLSTSQFTGLFNGMLSEAKAQNFAAFINTNGSFEVVVSVLMAPLTTLEGAAVDLYLRDPQRLSGDFAAAAGAANLQFVENEAAVGNAVSSATFSLPNLPLAMNGGLTASRHGKALQIALLFYPASSTPTLSSHEVAVIVDAKLASLDNTSQP